MTKNKQSTRAGHEIWLAPIHMSAITDIQTGIYMHDNEQRQHKSNYRKISNTIRTIFTQNRGPAAGVRIIHLN